EADVADHLAHHLGVVGHQTFRHVASQNAAQNTTEVFVTGVAQEAAAAGKHADETAQQTYLAQRHKLPDHSIPCDEERPTATELGPSRVVSSLQVSHDSPDHLAIARYDLLKDG